MEFTYRIMNSILLIESSQQIYGINQSTSIEKGMNIPQPILN